MKKKTSRPSVNSNLPVSKQTAGGIAGAIVGGVVAGPVGAVAGAIAGTIMGNRAAKGKSLVSSGTVKTASTAVRAVKAKLPSLKTKPSAEKKPPVVKTAKRSAPKSGTTKKSASKSTMSKRGTARRAKARK